MSIAYSCGTCMTSWDAPEGLAGKTVRCEGCGSFLRVPGPVAEKVFPPGVFKQVFAKDLSRRQTIAVCVAVPLLAGLGVAGWAWTSRPTSKEVFEARLREAFSSEFANLTVEKMGVENHRTVFAGRVVYKGYDNLRSCEFRFYDTYKKNVGVAAYFQTGREPVAELEFDDEGRLVRKNIKMPIADAVTLENNAAMVAAAVLKSL